MNAFEILTDNRGQFVLSPASGHSGHDSGLKGFYASYFFLKKGGDFDIMLTFSFA